MTNRARPSGPFWDSVSDDAALRRYDALVNAIDGGIYQLDSHGRFEAVNDAIVELTGYSREALVGEHASLVLPPADIDRVERAIRRRLAGDGDDEAFELEARTADGGRVPFELRMSLLVEDGDFRGTIGIVRDVSDRKRAERTLNEREQQLRRERDLTERILETSPVGIQVLDADGEITRINERAREVLDIPESGVGDYVPDDRPTYDEDGRPVSADEHPFATALETGEPVYDRLLEVERSDGESRWLSVSAAPLFDDDGAVDRVVTTGEDVTALKERERELERRTDELSSELEEVFDRISDAVYALDEEWRFTHVNERAEALLGRLAEELLGEVVWDAFPDVVGSELEDRYREAMATQEAVSFEWYADTIGIWAQINAYPSETGLSVYFRDVTERTERERELEEYERLVETIGDGVYVLDETGAFRRVNDAFAGMTRFDRSDLRGMHASVVFGDEFDAVDRESRGQFDADDGNTAVFEEEIYTADGDAITVESRFKRFDLEDGTGRAGVVRDVTKRKERERALAESERRYRALVDNFPNGAVAMYDEDLRYLLLGGDIFEGLARSPGELEGRTIPEVLPDALVDELGPKYSAVFDGERSDFEVEFDGEVRHFRAVPLYDRAGEVTAGLVISQDVTARVERERQLEEYRRWNETLVENFPSGAVALVDEDLRYVTFAGTVEGDADVTRADLEGSHVRDVLPPELEDVVVPHYEAALDGQASEFEDAIGDRIYQFHFLPVRDDDGDVFAATAMSRDITVQKERERYLRDAKSQLEAATEAGAVGTWEWRIPEDRFTAGASFAKTFGLDPEDAREGVPIERLLSSIHEGDRERIEREIEEAVDACGEYEAEYRVWNADDELQWVVARGHVECDEDGNAETFPGALTDITERKKYQQRLEESNERLEQFAYAASHDLQEPLRMVTSYLQLLDRRYADDLDGDAREFIDFAVDGADRMREMIDALLEYSRVETQGEPFEPVDLDGVFETARRDLELRIAETGATIDAEPLPRVEGDASQLRQVFLNLLENAIEYCGDDPPSVTVSAERCEAQRASERSSAELRSAGRSSGQRPREDGTAAKNNGTKWVVSVSDDGIGIDSDEQDRIFEVFQRLHSREEHAGTGIGLALCKRIVERHGGRIWVDSEPDEGSTFSFTLPADGDRFGSRENTEG